MTDSSHFRVDSVLTGLDIRGFLISLFLPIRFLAPPRLSGSLNQANNRMPALCHGQDALAHARRFRDTTAPFSPIAGLVISLGDFRLPCCDRVDDG